MMHFVYIFSFKSEIWHFLPSKGIETFYVVENRHLFNLFSIVCNFHRPFSCYFHVSQVKAVDESLEFLWLWSSYLAVFSSMDVKTVIFVNLK